MNRTYSTSYRLRPFPKNWNMVSVDLTVKTRRGDNLLVHKAINMAGKGDITEVDAGGRYDKCNH